MAKYDVKFIYAWPLKAQLLAVALLCAVVLFLAYFFDLSNLSGTLTKSRSKEIQLKKEMAVIFKDEATIRTSLKYVQQIEQALQTLKKEIISYTKLPELLNQMLNIGEKHQIHFHLFSPEAQEVIKIMAVVIPEEPVKKGKALPKKNKEEPKSLEIYAKVPIKIIAVGSYHDLSTFISLVANMQHIVSIGNFTLTNENKNAVLGEALAKQALSQNLLTLELTLEVPFLREGKNATV
jgi:type IV pilus assembly protein PilO